VEKCNEQKKGEAEHHTQKKKISQSQPLKGNNYLKRMSTLQGRTAGKNPNLIQ
jgi:hypothetical protein